MARVISGRGPVVAGALVVLATTVGCPAGGRAPAKDVVIGIPQVGNTTTSRLGSPARAMGTPGSGPFGVFVEEGSDPPFHSEPSGVRGLAAPDGEPWPAAIAFSTTQPVPDGLVFILVVGSDARPGEDLTRARADSLHLLAVNPKSRQGTLLGLPRDSWVEIPGHGRGKINSALTLGGPDLLAATVRQLTGLPVDYYVLTGFVGLARMVDELGGVDVFVERRMNDRASGARFERGWHRFNGAQALAFSRDRNDVERGDLTRSEHHGLLIVSALAKMRSEVADDDGVARWAAVLLRHTRLDVPPSRLPVLGALGRRLDPARLDNVVAPGRLGTADGQSVVFLTTAAARLFEDLRADAVVGAAEPAAPPEPEATTTTTTAPSTTTTTTITRAAPSTTSTTTRSPVPTIIR